MTGTALSRRSAGSERLVDLGLCAAMVAFVAPVVRATHPNPAVLAAVTIVAIALVFARRRWPVPSLAVAVVVTPIGTALLDHPNALFAATLVLIFTVAARTDRTTALIAAGGGIASFGVCILLLDTEAFIGSALLAAIAWPTLAAAAGDAVRSRAQVVAAAIDRAERAEASREEMARRRVAEERLHIARELHDLVAHNMTVVNVHAGVAEHFVRTDPEAAAEALRHVRTAAQAVLDEIAGILGVLRADDDPDSPTAPTPDLAALPSLVESFELAGLDLVYETTGEARPVDPTVALAAYRMIQEGLANALKHGDGHATLHLEHGPDRLQIVIDNRTAWRSEEASSSGSGFGIIGMRERISAVNGTLTVEHGEGHHRLVADLPRQPMGPMHSTATRP